MCCNLCVGIGFINHLGLVLVMVFFVLNVVAFCANAKVLCRGFCFWMPGVICND